MMAFSTSRFLLKSLLSGSKYKELNGKKTLSVVLACFLAMGFAQVLNNINACSNHERDPPTPTAYTAAFVI